MTNNTAEVSTQSILDEIQAFQVRHSLSLSDVSSILKISEVAIDSFRNTPYLGVDPTYLTAVQKRIENWEAQNSNPISAIQPQPVNTVEAQGSTTMFPCPTNGCGKIYDNQNALGGHLRHCGKSEDEQKEIARRSAATKYKKTVIEFDGKPPSVVIKLSRVEELVKYIDFDSNSKHIFTRDEDGSVTIYRA